MPLANAVFWVVRHRIDGLEKAQGATVDKSAVRHRIDGLEISE